MKTANDIVAAIDKLTTQLRKLRGRDWEDAYERKLALEWVLGTVRTIEIQEDKTK